MEFEKLITDFAARQRHLIIGRLPVCRKRPNAGNET